MSGPGAGASVYDDDLAARFGPHEDNWISYAEAA